MTWIVTLLVGLLPGIAADAIRKVVTYVLLGAGAAIFGGMVAYHLVTVHQAYERGADAARQKCSQDAATVRAKAETAYQLRARRLEAQLEQFRGRDKAAEDAEVANKSLEEEIAKMKNDPVAWTPAIVKGIMK